MIFIERVKMLYGGLAFTASPITRIGGKARLLTWLLPQIPYKENSIYVEPFFGSGAVFLNRPVSRIEVINDLDSSLIRFIRVLQKAEQKQLLLNRLEYTPYSKEEFSFAVEKIRNKNFVDDVDFAWSYFVANHQSFCGKSGWGRDFSIYAGKSNTVVSRWFSSFSSIDVFFGRVACARIENEDALGVIQRYDSKDTIIYCDPPYLLTTRCSKKIYENEMTEKQHEDFLVLAKKCKGSVCISGYFSDMYNDILQGWGMSRKEVVCQIGRNSPNGNKNEKRTECLWRNPMAMEFLKQQTLF